MLVYNLLHQIVYKLFIYLFSESK